MALTDWGLEEESLKSRRSPIGSCSRESQLRNDKFSCLRVRP